MRIAYLDCSTGISGDMTLSALIDAGVDPEAIQRGIASLNLPDVSLEFRQVVKGGFRATALQVTHPEQHAHRHFSDIRKLIEAAEGLSPTQKHLALQIFLAVAEAEARVHGSTVEKIHFHEVGAIDSIVDIVGAAIGFDLLNVDQIVCSPIPTGRGQVTIDHGICTVPTPGTAELLKGIPLWDVPVESELTTPTGAAIVKTLVHRFGHLPEMAIQEVGYGAGTRDFPNRANLLRLFVGNALLHPETDRVCLLETNLDDVTAEVIAYTRDRMHQAGALDIYTTSIQMKKNRAGVLLSVLANPESVEELETILFEETGTFGIRKHWIERVKRFRKELRVDTPWGPVLGKLGWLKGTQPIFTPEFEECARLAAHHGIPLREIYRAAESSYGMNPVHAGSVDTSHEHDHHSHDHDEHTPGHHSHDHDHHSHDHDHDHHSHDHDHDHHH